MHQNGWPGNGLPVFFIDAVRRKRKTNLFSGQIIIFRNIALIGGKRCLQRVIGQNVLRQIAKLNKGCIARDERKRLFFEKNKMP